MADWQRILDYMKTHDGITCKECEREIGTTELRKRICELKDKGYKIIDQWEEGTNRVGNPTRFKRYFLIGTFEIGTFEDQLQFELDKLMSTE